MSVRESLVELEELSSEQTLDMLLNQLDKGDLLLRPSSSFKLILNIKVLLSKVRSAMGRCAHTMQVFAYDNTNVEFKCPLCELEELDEQIGKEKPIIGDTKFVNHLRIDDETNEKLLMSDNEDEQSTDQYQSQTAEEFILEDESSIIDMLFSDVHEEDIEIIKYQNQTVDDLFEEGESNILEMLYPDLKMHVNDDDHDYVTIDNTEEEVIVIDIIENEPVSQNEAVHSNDKLELLKVSGAISVTMANENVKLPETVEKLKKKAPKVPLLFDQNLPEGWKRKVIERQSGKGNGFHVRIYGEGRGFSRKKELKKFVEDNKLTSIDPESVDFSVFGKNNV
eukprot:GFUD01139933.1.p1 GENE.GFUD01139933.1~~GFUD01139933.1.p1  ORF type:complete len:337 (+),score=97.99 GFUD01139933.1:34-1044(+)